LIKDTNKLKDIDPTRNVSSNATYLSLVYLMYKFAQTKDAKLTEEAIRELHFIFTIKALGSMFYRFFSYNLDVATAKASYEKLSNRFIIKKVGSWHKVIDYRAGDVLPNGVYYDRLYNLNTIEATKIVAGIHGGFKSMLIYIFGVITEVIKERSAISTTSIIESMEDGDAIRDDVDSPSLFINYISSIITHPNDVINSDYIHLIVVVSKNITDDNLKEVIRYFSINYDHKNDYILKQIIEQSIGYLRSKGVMHPAKDIIKALNLLRGYWSSGNVENKKLKDDIKVICYKATGRKTSWLLSSLTISTILYLYLRSILRK